MRSSYILSKNRSIHSENREISGPYNFWAPVKSNISDVWNWNCETFFGSKIEVGWPCPPAPPPSSYAPDEPDLINWKIGYYEKLENILF